MRRVILTIGPQYSGKTTFCKKVVAAHPEIQLLCRDEFFVEVLGSDWIRTSTEKREIAWGKIFVKVRELLGKGTVILDAYNSQPADRGLIVDNLRRISLADRVDAWVFTTPEDACVDWSVNSERARQEDALNARPLTAPSSEPRADIYRRLCWRFRTIPINRGLFDSVRMINVLEPPPTDSLFSL